MTTRALFLLAALGLITACRSGSQEPKEAAKAPAATPTAVAAAPVAAAPAAAKTEDCGGEVPADPAAADKQTVTTDATGQTVTAVGNKLAGAAVVKVADVLARPEEFAGKTVRLEGNVSAMCTHKRAWFALQSEDKSGAFVRIMGAPTFLVPEGSIGKKARTEGVVELIEVPAETQEHFAQEHQLNPEAGKAQKAGPHKTAVLKATGAEFI